MFILMIHRVISFTIINLINTIIFMFLMFLVITDYHHHVI